MGWPHVQSVTLPAPFPGETDPPSPAATATMEKPAPNRQIVTR